jgi:threonine dehydratase
VALDDMLTVSESEIAEAIAWLAREHELQVEGSGAVGVAALLHSRVASLEGPAAVVLSGGNIDAARWSEVVRGG